MICVRKMRQNQADTSFREKLYITRFWSQNLSFESLYCCMQVDTLDSIKDNLNNTMEEFLSG